MSDGKMTLCRFCDRMGHEARPESSPGVCEACYADGWRTGAEMTAALKADPVLNVDDAGKVGLREHEVGVPRLPPSKDTA